jgi:4-amino-4-deoxy-L-arabinose transferase-like glycosyltransferase
MSEHSRNSIVMAAIAAIVFFAGLGSSRLLDEDEPIYAVCSHEMFNRGDWVVPTYNDKLCPDKPILTYWCMIAAYSFLGVSELAARLPSALAGVGSVVLTYQLGRLMFDARTGLLASCLFASAINFAILARTGTPDSLLIFCMTASLTSFVAGVAARRGGHFSGTDRTGQPVPVQVHGLPVLACVGMYVGMGLAVLAKGPIGVVLPLGIVGSYLLFCDDVEAAPAGSGWLRSFARYFAPRRIFRVMSTLRLSWGLPLLALVALPWYILVAIRTNGEWVVGFIGTHNVGRFLHPMQGHHGLPIYYLVAILVGFFPGSVFLPVALWPMITSVRHNGVHRSAAAFLLCWVGCVVGFFTLAATKLPNYVVPCYPALAIVTGFWLSAEFGRARARDWRLWAGYSSLVAIAVFGTIAAAIVAHVLLKIDPLPALPGVVAIVGGTACLVLLHRGRAQASIAAFIVTCLFFTSWATVYTAMRVSKMQDGPLLAERIRNLDQTNSNGFSHIAMFRYFAPSFVYYLGHPIPNLDNPDQIPTFFDRGGDALVLPRAVYDQQRAHMPNNVTVLAEEQRFLRKDERVVLVGRSTEVARGAAREKSR